MSGVRRGVGRDCFAVWPLSTIVIRQKCLIRRCIFLWRLISAGALLSWESDGNYINLFHLFASWLLYVEHCAMHAVHTFIYLNVKFTTLSNGYLGSRNDEERSEMRYVMRIAEFSESSNLWTQIALLGSPRSTPLSVSVQPSLSSVFVYSKWKRLRSASSFLYSHVLAG